VTILNWKDRLKSIFLCANGIAGRLGVNLTLGMCCASSYPRAGCCRSELGDIGMASRESSFSKARHRAINFNFVSNFTPDESFTLKYIPFFQLEIGKWFV